MRLKGLPRHNSIFSISIHAPARGATKTSLLRGPMPMNFNPRTREGCDPKDLHKQRLKALFQSTHPRGVRLSLSVNIMGLGKISIHAPARGATCHLDCVFSIFFRFQSTHPRGVRRKTCRVTKIHCVFQSTHPRGVRLEILGESYSCISRFQSTHPRGVRHPK